ncbi:MAG: abortive infection family protein [Actinobacteria bacterium]|nr:abortive infection family protein [Actinomycetota bacterium]
MTKRLLSNLSQVAIRVAELRNEYGPDHGRTGPSVRLEASTRDATRPAAGSRGPVSPRFGIGRHRACSDAVLYERRSTERSVAAVSALCACARRRRSTRGPTRRMRVHTTREKPPAKAK